MTQVVSFDPGIGIDEKRCWSSMLTCNDDMSREKPELGHKIGHRFN
jgi:hypothetical protein